MDYGAWSCTALPILLEEIMTDKRKIEILERLLDERDTQIQELQMRITELEETVESYKCVDDDMRELRNLVKNGHKMNDEYNKMNREYN